MAGICCGVVGESETVAVESSSRSVSRRRAAEMIPMRYVAGVAAKQQVSGRKRQRLEIYRPSSSPREVANAVESCAVGAKRGVKNGVETSDGSEVLRIVNPDPPVASVVVEGDVVQDRAKFGKTSVCGRRRDMEDAVAIHPSFCRRDSRNQTVFHFYGVYDGHGCSHVSMMCKERMHEIVKEEIECSNEDSRVWSVTMERSFKRMDEEVTEFCSGAGELTTSCRCELQTPQCDAVGSTAVVAVVTPDQIVVSNCGDSRAVLCRNGVAIPLSADHKPDRPDELNRIQAAGGRVIYWDGPRVLGVLAMSRAIGDNYLKPYVIPEPEVTVTDRSVEDECLILASDGLWDVVSNETACGVVRMCLRAQTTAAPPRAGSSAAVNKACSDASILLTKLALARNTTDNVSVVVVDLRKQQ